MKILISSVSYWPSLNGQAIFTHNLAEGLAARGHQVLILAPREEISTPEKIPLRVRVQRVSALGLERIHRGLRVPFVSDGFIRRIFEEFRPDLIHVQDPSPLSLAVLRSARKLGIPTVITHHSGPEITAPYVRIHQRTLKRLTNAAAWQWIVAFFHQADLVITPSQFSAEMIKAHGTKTPLEVVPNGIALERFSTLPENFSMEAVRRAYKLDLHKKLFLYVGRLDAEKNLELLLRAVALAAQDEIQLALAGTGSEQQKLGALAQELGIANQVIFLGGVENCRLPELLRSADVFVMPGQAESFSLSTLEAMACARPILVPAAGALPELVTHLENGLLYQPDDPASGAQAIQTLAALPAAQLAEMGRASLQRSRRYSLDAMAVGYERVYHRIFLQNPCKAVDRPILPRLSAALFFVALFMASSLLYGKIYPLTHLRQIHVPVYLSEPGRSLISLMPYINGKLLNFGRFIQQVIENAVGA